MVLSENRFDAGIFSLEYPRGWRVVKLNTADANYVKVAFVAPDQSVVTLTQVENADNNVIRLENGVTLAVEITARATADSDFFNMAKGLVRSMRA